GDGDTRVAPLHARKMAALLQASTGSDRPVLLLYDTKSGHSGGRPINKIIEEDTDILSFIFWQLEVPQAGDYRRLLSGVVYASSLRAITQTALERRWRVGIKRDKIPERLAAVAA